MNIKGLKLITGEDIIADVVISDDVIVLNNPVQIVMVPTHTQQPSMAFVPYPFYTSQSYNKTLEISKKHIIFKCDVDEEIYNKYNTAFGSGIVTASSNFLK